MAENSDFPFVKFEYSLKRVLCTSRQKHFHSPSAGRAGFQSRLDRNYMARCWFFLACSQVWDRRKISTYF